MIYQHKIQPKSKIALILIDEKTLNTYQSEKDAKILTIPKSTYARLIDELENLGVKGIGFDIIFQNPDEYEEIFAQKIINSKNTVIATEKPTQTFEELQKKKDPCLKSGYEKICPLTPREVYKNAKWGFIGHKTNKRIIGYDIKSVPAQKWKMGDKKRKKVDDDFIYTLPLTLVQNEDLPVVETLKKKVRQRAGNKKPLNALEQYMGPPHSYLRISLVDFLKNPEKYKNEIKNAYVLVGESGTIIHDIIQSPVNRQSMPGVESHAHFLDAILQDKFLVLANQEMMFLSYVILSLIFVIIYIFVPNLFSPFIFILSSFATIWIARYLYDQERILVDIFPLLLSVSLLSYPITMIYRFFIVDKQKRRILSSFGRYVSPKVVGMIDTNNIEAQLGGERKKVSILFSDIAGFTTLSEKLDPKDLFVVMTAYLSKMTKILLSQ